MTTPAGLLSVFAVIALGATLLHKRAGLSKALCCALCAALCVCAAASVSVWRWTQQAYRPAMRIEALREPDTAERATDSVCLRNVFSISGESSRATFPSVLSGVWAQTEDGLCWQEQPEIEGQTDAIEVSMPAAERYAVYFIGDRQSGKALITCLDTGERQVVDTYRDSEERIAVIVDIGLDGTKHLARMRRATAVGLTACAAVSVALFVALYRALRKHLVALENAWRAAGRFLDRMLSKSRLAHAPLDSRRWSRWLFALFVLFMIPLLAIAVYAHPAFDDYSYGLLTKQAWERTGSLSAVFRGAILTARDTYDSWQGSFSAIFLMALQPGIFGERLYVLTPLLLIGSLVASTWWFSRALIGKREGAVLCWLTLFFSVQYAPGADEAFFWFNGGIYYTFYYSLSLILYGMVLRAHRTNARAKRALYAVGACLLAFFAGGGNFVTTLLSCVLLALLTGYRWIRKDRRGWVPLSVFLCLAGSLGLNLAAPGNAIRQAAADAMPYHQAIYASFRSAYAYFVRGMRVEYVLGALIALPFLYRAAERSGCSFRYPGLVTLASFCAYACQFMPYMASYSMVGPSRLRSIIFYSNLWLIGGNCFYWCGWKAKRRNVQNATRILARWAAVAAAAALIPACVIAAVHNPAAINGVSAAISLADGSAQRYGQALADRQAIYEDEDVRDAVIVPLPERPLVLKYAEILESNKWAKEVTAAYYGKDSIRVAE